MRSSKVWWWIRVRRVGDGGDLDLVDYRGERGAVERLVQPITGHCQVGAVGHVHDVDVHPATVDIPVHRKVKGC